MNELHLITYGLFVLLSSQGIGLILTLLHPTKRSISSALLAFLVLVVMTVVILLSLQHQPFIKISNLTLTHQPLIFLLFPLIFLYLSSIVKDGFQLKERHLLHFLAPLLIAINLLPFYALNPDQKTVFSGLENQFIVISWWWHLCVLCIQGCAYTIALMVDGTLKKLFRLRHKNLNADKVIIILFGVLLILAIIRLLSNYTVDTQTLSLFFLSLVIITIGTKFWFNYKPLKISSLKSTLENDLCKKYLTRLVEAVIEKELYKNEKLTISELALEVNIPSYHISRVINQELKMNFCDFINTYRINEAKTLLIDQTYDAKILRVAYESGFSSRSTFYAAFKKHTGLTPTQFRAEKKCPDS